MYQVGGIIMQRAAALLTLHPVYGCRGAHTTATLRVHCHTPCTVGALVLILVHRVGVAQARTSPVGSTSTPTTRRGAARSYPCRNSNSYIEPQQNPVSVASSLII